MADPYCEYVFDKDLTQRLRQFSGPSPSFLQKWSLLQFSLFLLMVMAVLGLLANVPNRFFNPAVLHVTIVLGTLGFWRFGWWFTHAVRAAIYRYFKWPGMRKRANALWATGWRPKRLHIQMTTYFEDPSITKRVVGSILGQIRREAIPTTLYVGTGSAFDEDIIRRFIEIHAQDIADDLARLVFVRQNQPGKRMAIGLVLRAMCRAGAGADDLLIFMDGDAILGNDVLEKTLPLFGADPELQALTTDEEVICYGPRWIAKWLDMRFAQRRLAMQSHALSDRVLTLTGRMSVFRVERVLRERFIRTIEADHLDHWLWGRFRFLSGDDKSSWYQLLSQRSKMTYVPDATVYTIEVIKGKGLDRMVQNFRRWSGNMLRNGSRAIALGPGIVPPFIWWCIVDQRIAMWTMMVSPVMAVLGTLIAPGYFWNCVIWVLFSRIVLCFFLFGYSRRADMSWPFILYFNQVINASVKIYMVFHLSRQSWANRGNQSAGSGSGRLAIFKGLVAKLQMGIAIMAFLTGLMAYVGLVSLPF